MNKYCHETCIDPQQECFYSINVCTVIRNLIHLNINKIVYVILGDTFLTIHICML